jgi:hypothetical protein
MKAKGCAGETNTYCPPPEKKPIFLFLLSLDVFEKQRAICRSVLWVARPL